jgi:hypothetical protein
LAAQVPADQAVVDLGTCTGRATGWLLLGAGEGYRAHVTTVARVESDDDRQRLGAYMARVGATSAEHTIAYTTPAKAAASWSGPPVGLLRHSGHGDVTSDLSAWLPHLADGAVVVVHEAADPGVADTVRQVLGSDWDDQIIPWVYKGQVRRTRGLLVAQKSTYVLPPGPQTVVNTTGEPIPVVAQQADTEDETSGVPRILHRIWLDDPMPAEFEQYGQRWRELHPDWEIREWRSTADLPPLINQDLFDAAREICPKDWKRFQADLLRLELLHQFGGVYVDTDVEPLKAFDPLLDRKVLVAYSPHRDRSNRRLLTQAVLGSVPGHPWIRACIDALPDAVKRYAGKPLAQMIGPHHITRVWRCDPAGVVPLEAKVFYPQSNSERDTGQTPDLDGAYCHHKWNNTLRKQGKGLG